MLGPIAGVVGLVPGDRDSDVAAVQSQFDEPRTPFPDRLLCDAFPGSYRLVGQSFGAAEHDP